MTTTDTDVTITGLKPNKKYYVKVRACISVEDKGLWKVQLDYETENAVVG